MNKNKIITNLTDMVVYFQLIQKTQATSVLDVGLFLERIGAVSRTTSIGGISESVVLEGISMAEERPFPIYESIYNQIHFELPEKRFSFISLLRIADLWKEEDAFPICKYAMAHGNMFLFESSNQICKDFFEERMNLTPIESGNDIYLFGCK